MSEPKKPCSPGCRHVACGTTPKAEITRRLYDRLMMNVHTSKMHPDPAVRERADARADAYIIAIEIVSEELS